MLSVSKEDLSLPWQNSPAIGTDDNIEDDDFGSCFICSVNADCVLEPGRTIYAHPVI